MQVEVFKNPSAIRFIRCVAEIPFCNTRAAGAGFTLREALAKCHSEVVERSFYFKELKPIGVFPLGIAAYPTYLGARARALQECAETLCLRQIHCERKFFCFLKLQFARLSIGVARTGIGYFCLIRGEISNQPIAAHSAGPSLISTLLKAWEEYRSLHFFVPQGDALRTFTKANNLFSRQELNALEFHFEPQFKYQTRIDKLVEKVSVRERKTIVYFT